MIIKNNGILPGSYAPKFSIERNETYYRNIEKYIIEPEFNPDDTRYFKNNFSVYFSV